jgi:hypothetical protein
MDGRRVGSALIMVGARRGGFGGGPLATLGATVAVARRWDATTLPWRGTFSTRP